MKYLIPIFFVYIFTACMKGNNNQLITHTVDLKNNIGQISMSIPAIFDTSYSWTFISDNSCGDYEMFRFANKKYSLIEETGSFQVSEPDSLYQITIQQFKNPKCFKADFKINSDYRKTIMEKMKIENEKINPDVEIIAINGRDFLVSKIKSFPNKKDKILIEARTIVNNQLVIVSFEYIGNSSSGFVSDMLECLRSIKIK